MNEKESTYELMGDQHMATGMETPLRTDAFVLPDNEKIKAIAHHFEKIMETLGLELCDDSLQGTPYRVAKMYVKELFWGLNPQSKPNMSVFDNRYAYNKVLVEKDIRFHSACEHHFLPIIGRAHIGYVSSGKVIGLSKLNRIVQYYSRRPQVQERLTVQIFQELKEVLGTDDVIVVIEAEHLCVSSRGVSDPTSCTTTLQYGGIYEELAARKEFLILIR